MRRGRLLQLRASPSYSLSQLSPYSPLLRLKKLFQQITSKPLLVIRTTLLRPYARFMLLISLRRVCIPKFLTTQMIRTSNSQEL